MNVYEQNLYLSHSLEDSEGKNTCKYSNSLVHINCPGPLIKIPTPLFLLSFQIFQGQSRNFLASPQGESQRMEKNP